MAGSHAQRALGELHHLLGASAPAEDERLLQRFVCGRDEEAFAQLVARYGPLVLGVCRRVLHDCHEAEDVFQATFLVLARKAAGIRKPESLSCFLHGVAYRLALKARLDSDRRRQRERHIVPPEPAAEPDLSWREVRALIDEELLRLPERLRLPLVLCYLEGQTQDEAARRLGWPRGTLKRRLESGRDRLRVRLTRRGVTLGTGLFVGALTAPAAPAALRNAVVRAALAFRVGELGTPAAILAQAALPSISGSLLKMLGALVLALGCVAAVAGLTARQAGLPSQAKSETGRPVEEKRVLVDRYGDVLPEGAKLRLGTIRLRNGQTPCDAVFTPDGKTAIVGDSGGDIIFWDVATGHEVRRLPRVQSTIYTLAITPDGKKLAAGSDQTLYLWDVAGGKMLSQAKVTNGTVYGLVITPDGKKLALADATPTITVWDAANNRKLHELKGHTGTVAAIALSPDGKTLASGSWGDGHIRLWDLAAGKEKFRFVAHEKDVFAVAFSPDGKTLASEGNSAPGLFRKGSTSFCFWDAATGTKIREIPNHYAPAFAFFPDGKMMAALDYHRNLQIYDVQTGKRLREFEAPPRTMIKLAIAPDGKTVATLGNIASAFDLWDATAGKLLHSFEGHRGGVTGLAFAADDSTLFSSSDDLVGAWDTTTGVLRGRFGDARQGGNALALSPDGKRLATGGLDSFLIWDPATRKEVRRYNPNWLAGRRPAVISVSWSADGKVLASRSAPEGIIRVWDVATDRQRLAIETGRAVGRDWTGEIALSPDGSVLAAGGSPDGRIYRWSVATGEKLPAITPSQGIDQLVAFAPDGSTLASAGERGWIHLWEPATGRLRHGWDTKSGAILRLTFSRDGRTLATGHGDNTVRLWETATGSEWACFVGHRGPVGSVALSHDGRTLASGSADTTILLWDATCGASPEGVRDNGQLPALWDDLKGTDARRAYKAMWQMALSPRQALPFLAERLPPVLALDAKQQQQFDRLLADLDSEQFGLRQHAETELEKMGSRIEPALHDALTRKPLLEVRRRIEKMLEKLAGGQWRTGRALEAIEHMNTPEARQLLDALAKGEPRAWLTEQARLSHARMGR